MFNEDTRATDPNILSAPLKGASVTGVMLGHVVLE